MVKLVSGDVQKVEKEWNTHMALIDGIDGNVEGSTGKSKMVQEMGFLRSKLEAQVTDAVVAMNKKASEAGSLEPSDKRVLNEYDTVLANINEDANRIESTSGPVALTVELIALKGNLTNIYIFGVFEKEWDSHMAAIDGSVEGSTGKVEMVQEMGFLRSKLEAQVTDAAVVLNKKAGNVEPSDTTVFNNYNELLQKIYEDSDRIHSTSLPTVNDPRIGIRVLCPIDAVPGSTIPVKGPTGDVVDVVIPENHNGEFNTFVPAGGVPAVK